MRQDPLGTGSRKPRGEGLRLRTAITCSKDTCLVYLAVAYRVSLHARDPRNVVKIASAACIQVDWLSQASRHCTHMWDYGACKEVPRRHGSFNLNSIVARCRSRASTAIPTAISSLAYAVGFSFFQSFFWCH